VLKSDVYEFLRSKPNSFEKIHSKNLLEHLENPGLFFSLCEEALIPGGRLTVITDNAEFFPFYLPFWLRHTGIGAHSMNDYALDFCESKHFMVFTKMHLRNFLEAHGFERVEVSRDDLGARLFAMGFKKTVQVPTQSQ
jgi:tRNA G46 methylase TrmB